MNKLDKIKLIHYTFRITTFLKGIYSFFEVYFGFLLFFIPSNDITLFFERIFQGELLEDPNDLVANSIIHFFGILTPLMKEFIALYLIIHGIIKVGLVIALLLEKQKAYPVAGLVFALFISYQLYKSFLNPSWILVFLTIIDLVIIILLYFEYKHLNYWIRLKKEGKDKFFGV